MGAPRAVTFAVTLSSLCILCTVSGCADRELAPLGEVLVVVDTDLPVPRVASALRVDTYASDGTWLESRDIALRDPRDWPASFSVQSADDLRERDVVVRLRIHGERVRDVVSGPRLVSDGRDVTPVSEPEPSLTVDRVLLLHLSPGRVGRTQVVARASCAGIAARLEPGALESCTSGEGTRERVTVETPEPDLTTPRESLAGTAARTPCTVDPSIDRVCVEGGAFIVGADDVQVVPDADLPATPERVARVQSFAIDRDEVTVGRLRAALARGFAPPEPPGATEGDLGAAPETACSFSASPRGREEFALSCVTWRTARAYCAFTGGDLPTEAQWEYAATSAARAGKTMFPWGDEPPDCERAIYGRLTLAGLPGGCEKAWGSGPRPASIDGAPIAPGDVSASRVRGLGGGVAEWTRDTPARYDAPCWRGIDPSCSDPTGEAHVLRGGAWASTAINVRSTARLAGAKPTSFIGFRCVYAR